MRKEINPHIKKKQDIFTPAIVLIAVFTFFTVTVGNFLIDSQYQHVKDFYTDFITGDILIRHNESSHTSPFIIPDFFPTGEYVIDSDEYSSIKNFLLNNEKIESFTPYSLIPVNFINENKGKILFQLKIIDMQSFFSVFPEISFIHSDNSPMDSVQGIFLPQILTFQIRNILNTALAEGDSLLLTDETAQISSVRETFFSGIVTYNGYSTIFPKTGYSNVNAYPLQGTDVAFNDDSHDNTEKIQVSFFPDKDTFYKEFITNRSPIQKNELTDPYFFEFFNFNRKAYDREKPIIPAWQFIAVTLKQKDDGENVKRTLNKQFSINDQNVIALSWKDTTRPVLNTILIFRIFLYIIILFMLLVLFVITFLKIKNTIKSFTSDKKHPDQGNFIFMIRKLLLTLNINIIISSAAGIITGIFIVLIINMLRLSPGRDIMSILFAGGNTLSISISIAPIFLSILLSFIFTIMINIYSFTIVSRLRHHNENQKKQAKGVHNEK